MTTISEQMAAWGRKGGESRSEKKREAARKNVAERAPKSARLCRRNCVRIVAV